MSEPTKKEKRRANLLDDYWFKLYGDPKKPKSNTRNWRKHMKNPALKHSVTSDKHHRVA